MSVPITPEQQSKQRILVVTSWAPPMIGGPQNLYTLFSCFDKEDYVILTSGTMIKNSLKLGSWLDGTYRFFDTTLTVKTLSTQTLQNSPTSSSPTTTRRTLVKRFLNLPAIVFCLSGLSFPLRVLQITRAGVRSVREEHCTLVLGISDTGPAMIASWLISIITHRPLVYYLFDLYAGNLLPLYERLLAKYIEPYLFRSARKVIVTNDGTLEYYQKKYGPSFRGTVVHNSVFDSAYSSVRRPYNPTPPYTIVFTGHVYWAQEQALKNLLTAMHDLTDLPLTLDLYVPNPPTWLQETSKKSASIRLLSAPQSEMAKIQSEASLLFLPLSWNTKSPDIVRTATPGKFTDYLASGRPMLIHAPDYAIVSKYGRRYGLGIVVDENNSKTLATELRKFFNRPEVGQNFVARQLKTFSEHYDAPQNARKLSQILFGDRYIMGRQP